MLQRRIVILTSLKCVCVNCKPRTSAAEAALILL